MTLEEWNKVIETNLTGTFLCSQAAGKVMIKQGGGKIINIASVAGLRGAPPDTVNAIAYHASKGGVISFTKDLAWKWAQHNIQVNAICSGPLQGERMRRIIEQRAQALNVTAAEVERTIVAGTVLKRMIPPEDVAAMAAYLASAEADNITGQAIDVSAGDTL